MRFYIVGMCILYFVSWGYYSNWDPYLMLFMENDIKATMARLTVGFVLLVGSILALTEATGTK